MPAFALTVPVEATVEPARMPLRRRATRGHYAEQLPALWPHLHAGILSDRAW